MTINPFTLAKLPVGFYFMASPALAGLLLADPRGGARRGLLRSMVPPAVLALAVGATAGVRYHLGLWPGFGLQELAQKNILHTGSGSLAHNFSEAGGYLFGRAMEPESVGEQVVSVLASPETVSHLRIVPRYPEAE